MKLGIGMKVTTLVELSEMGGTWAAGDALVDASGDVV